MATNKGVKRKLSQDDFDTDDSVGSPQAQSCSTPVASPNKQHLDYDFFNDGPSASTSSAAQVNVEPCRIGEIKTGKYTNQFITFRVTFKSDIRTFEQGSSGKLGKVFSFHALDATGEVGISAFGVHVDSFYSVLEVNQVYKLQNFTAKDENLQYPSGTGNPIQLVLNDSSIIDSISAEIPEIPFQFLALNELANVNVNENVDVVGILVKDWQLEKTATGRSIRRLSLIDNTKTTVPISLWGTLAENFACIEFSVIAFRRAKVSEYLGKRNLNCNYTTLIWENPKVKENVELTEWFQNLKR